MTGYLVRRVGQMGLTLFLIFTVTFFLVEAQPGDYASFYALNPDLPPDVKEKIRSAFGLDKPLWHQYIIHLKNTLTGNFGVSFSHYPRPVLGRVGGARPTYSCIVPHSYWSVLLHRVFLGQGHSVEARRAVRIYRHNLRSHPLYCLHAGFRADDDLDIRLQVGVVPRGEIPGPPCMAGK